MKFPVLERRFYEPTWLCLSINFWQDGRRCKFDLERVLEFDSFPTSRIFRIDFHTPVGKVDEFNLQEISKPLVRWSKD